MCLLCGLWILFIFREKKDNDEGNVLTFNGPSTTPPNVMLSRKSPNYWSNQYPCEQNEF